MERRNTIQKDLVLSAVMNMHRHVTADEVYEFIRLEYPTIGKGTVYRNLNILADDNKIRRVEIPNGPDRFDFILQKHYHLRCIKCGKILDVAMDEIPEIEAYIHSTQEMVLLDYDILFKGICPECREKEEEDHQET